MAMTKVGWASNVLNLALLGCLLSLRGSNADDVIVEGTSSHYRIGINYGRVADNLPSPAQAVALIQKMQVGSVKIYDSDSGVLNALANTGLQVVICVTNQDILNLASSAAAADQWIATNVVAYPNTMIRVVQVGNELFSYPSLNSTWYALVPAIKNLQTSLLNRNLANTVKISTCVAMDVLSNSFPPSAGVFRSDIAIPILQPLLQFLYDSGSAFYVNVYPYFAWASNPADISLNYALFEAGSVVNDGGLQYTNLLDAQLDAVIAAMEKLGYGQTYIAVSETGWPTAGDPSQVGAEIPYAAYYNRRLVRRYLASPAIGTPRRPSTFIPIYLFALFNEDLKPGPTTERNWGLLYPNGSQVYAIDLTGQLSDTSYPPFATTVVPPAAAVGVPPPQAGSSAPTAQEQVVGTWCVANTQAQVITMQSALDYACGQGGADCGPIQYGQVCYNPNSLAGHGSYAFNSYYQMEKNHGGTCDFGGAAVLTNLNPSFGDCIFPYVP